jgi:hypothetical protein
MYLQNQVLGLASNKIPMVNHRISGFISPVIFYTL